MQEYIGNAISNKSFSNSQRSEDAQILYREADRLQRIADDAPSRYEAKQAKADAARKQAENYGNTKSIVRGTVGSNAAATGGQEMIKLIEKKVQKAQESKTQKD